MIEREKDLDRLVSNGLKKTGECYPVENHAINGMSDFYYSSVNKVAWIEDKVINDASEKVKFRPGQATFLTKNDLVAETYVIVYNKNNKCFYCFEGKQSKGLESVEFEKFAHLSVCVSKKLKEVIRCIVT